SCASNCGGRANCCARLRRTTHTSRATRTSRTSTPFCARSKARLRMASPTQRSLAKWREAGAIAQVVERWNPHAKVRQDLFGCIDIIVVEKYLTIGVQSTTAANSAARVDKA